MLRLDENSKQMRVIFSVDCEQQSRFGEGAGEFEAIKINIGPELFIREDNGIAHKAIPDGEIDQQGVSGATFAINTSLFPRDRMRLLPHGGQLYQHDD